MICAYGWRGKECMLAQLGCCDPSEIGFAIFILAAGVFLSVAAVMAARRL